LGFQPVVKGHHDVQCIMRMIVLSIQWMSMEKMTKVIDNLAKMTKEIDNLLTGLSR
jgi:hypothetical protein